MGPMGATALGAVIWVANEQWWDMVGCNSVRALLSGWNPWGLIIMEFYQWAPYSYS